MVLLALVLAAPAEAHRSASSSGPLFHPYFMGCRTATAVDKLSCVGPRQARTVAKSLALPEAKQLEGWSSAARDQAIWAAYFNVREAIAPLRTWLAIRIEPADRDSHVGMTKQALMAEAAFALARLGDTASKPKIAALVRDFETTGYGSLWEDTLAALAELDPAAASSYAIDFVQRGKLTKLLPGGSSPLIVLDRITDGDRARPILAKLEHLDDLTECEVLATRARLDPEVRASVRAQFVGDYSGTTLAGCAERVIARLGNDPADAAALVRHLGRKDAGMDFGMTNLAYLRILELERVLAGRHDAAANQARELIRAGLTERSSWPHVADPTANSYSLHYAILHTVALAGVGDPAAIKKLGAALGGTDDATWLGEVYDLQLALPGSLDRAAALLVRSIGQSGGDRGKIFEDVHTRVLDAFVARAPDDGRWAVALLDREPDAQEHALSLLARRAPKHACEAVTGAATVTTEAGAQFAFLALATQPDSCIGSLGILADSPKAPNGVRGAAIELLAAFDAPDLCAHLRTGYRDSISPGALDRATRLRTPSCGN